MGTHRTQKSHISRGGFTTYIFVRDGSYLYELIDFGYFPIIAHTFQGNQISLGEVFKFQSHFSNHKVG